MTLQTYWRMTSGCTKCTRCRALYGGIEIFANIWALLERQEKDCDIRKACYNWSNDTLTVYLSDSGFVNYERWLEDEQPKR